MYVYICVCVCVCMCAGVYIYTHMGAHTHTHVYTCMCIYPIHSVTTFPKGISPKVNAMAWQEFELTYYGVIVHHVS